MAGSETELCNRALRAVGADPIVDLIDTNVRAATCRDEYPAVRNEVLRAHPWNCAMKRIGLAALSEGPAWGFDYQYELPPDCLRVWRINSSHPLTAFRVEGRRVLTSQTAPLEILYIGIPEVGKFDPLLESAIVARLAAALATTLKESQSSSDAHWKRYRDLLREARAIDAHEGTPEDPWQDAFVEARFGAVWGRIG